MSNPPKSTKLENRKDYKQFNRFLDMASNRTKEIDNERKKCQTPVNLFISGMLKKLRQSNKLFDKMCTKAIPSGNYFDCPEDLDPDENQLNIILKLPFDDAKSVTVEHSKKPGYCKLNINNAILKKHENDPFAQEFRDKFLHQNNCIRVNGLVAWFERIFNDYFSTQSGGNKNYYVLEIVQKNGETLTFSIDKPVKSTTGILIKVHVGTSDVQFSIDISLGMEFDKNSSHYRSKIPTSIESEKWIAVAKPDKSTLKDDVDWLCSFYTIERKLLQDTNKAVPLIRIFKQFFNSVIVPNLNTYLIENIFFFEIVKQENARKIDFWQSSLASLFLHMLDVILASLNENLIRYFWDNNVNLAQGISHKKIFDKLKEHKTLLENQISMTEMDVYFDDLFFKIGNGGSGNLSQDHASSTMKSIFNKISKFRFFSTAGCQPAENIVPASSSPSTKNEEVNGHSNVKPNTPILTTVSRDIPSSSGMSSVTRSISTMSISDSVGRKNKKSVNATLILQLLSKFIKIKERQEYTEHYNAVLNYFITELKSDDVFARIYRGHVMGGSYTDDLKVSKPNEFDTILRFNFGVDKTKIRVQKCKIKSGYCNINLKECDLNVKPYLSKFLDDNGYVLQDEILKWMQRLFTFILQKHNDKTININNNSYQYSHSRNGPAFTFCVKVLGTDIEFDMDLVPAFQFDENNWLATREYPKDKNKIKWIAVPKPPKEGITNKNPSFICSYTELEKTYLHDANNTKNLIRLFKKLRDKNDLKSLKSYFIKTIFLWQFNGATVAERNAFWGQPLDVLFLKMFKIILTHIERRELLFFWDTTYNMFSTITPSVLQSMQERLGGIYSKIETNLKDNKNPEYLIDIILTKNEKTIFLLEHAERLSRD